MVLLPKVIATGASSTIEIHQSTAADGGFGIAFPSDSLSHTPMKFQGALLSLSLVFGLSGVGQAVDFHKEILPILETNCFRCHGNGESKGRVSLDADKISKHIRSSGHINPGNADRSIFVEVLVADDPEDRMPKNKPPLAPNEIALIKTWINEGAEVEMAEVTAEEEPAMEEAKPQPLEGKWTNKDGQTIEATLLEVKGTDAVLQMGTKTFNYPIGNLSEESQQIIKDWMESGKSAE